MEYRFVERLFRFATHGLTTWAFCSLSILFLPRAHCLEFPAKGAYTAVSDRQTMIPFGWGAGP